MKRWLIIAIPLAIFTALLFVKPPSFTSHPYSATPGVSNTSGTKPAITGGGDDEQGGLVNGEKPAYGGSESDTYTK